MSNFNVNYSFSSQCCGSYPHLFVPTTSSQQGYFHQAKAELDATLADSMAQMSFDERQMGQEDLHGVSEAIIEDRAQTDAWLIDLDIHLKAIKQGSVYEIAETMDSSHVRDREFRLLFLRSNRYNAKNAAKQMLNFFNMKLQLFGRTKLTKEITFSDLSDDDKECLKTGCMQILPTTDRAGRQILFQFPGLRNFKMLENELRARFYISNCLWKSQETQRKGLVMVTYAMSGLEDKMNGAGFAESTKLILALPLYVAGAHMSTDNVAQYVLGKAAISLMPVSTRARCKFHLGSDQECQYILSTFGIPREALPLDPKTNKPALGEFLVWFNQQQLGKDPRMFENELDSHLRPAKNDVLFVAGQKVNNAGNERFRALAKKESEYFDLMSNEKKTEIYDEIVNEIKRCGGRFLKQNGSDGLWMEVDVSEVRRKLGQMIRNFRHKRLNREKEKSSTHLGTKTKFVTVDQLHPNDVLFGPLTCKNHQGNVLLRQAVKGLASEYDSAPRVEKMRLTQHLLQQSTGLGGRFLKQSELDSDRWEKLPDDVARSKISKLFRNVRRLKTTKHQ